jgi:small subunit ribosomal protein S6
MAMIEKNKYELMVIIKPLLPENVRMGVESKIIETLETAEGKVTKTDVWGKRHLAYRMQKHTEGFFVVYNFETAPADLANIEKVLKLNKDILRYLLINTDN